MKRILVLLSLVLSTSALAESRVAVLGFKGPMSKALRTQFVEDLCQKETCVKRGKKGDEVQVDAVVVGATKWEKKRLRLELQVYVSQDSLPTKVSIPVPKSGKLSRGALASIVESVRAAIPEKSASADWADGTNG